jgi:hypothetical protein
MGKRGQYKVGDAVVCEGDILSESDSVYSLVGYIIEIQSTKIDGAKSTFREYLVSTELGCEIGYWYKESEIEPSIPEMVGLYLQERRYPEPEGYELPFKVGTILLSQCRTKGH